MYSPIERICQYCNKLYLGNPNSKYCGYDCSHTSRKRRISLVCQECNKEFERQEWNKDAKFCSFNCKVKNQSSDIIKVKCTNCSIIFNRKDYLVYRHKSNHSFCCKKCADEYNKRSNHYEWKEDLFSNYNVELGYNMNKLKSQSEKSIKYRARKLKLTIKELLIKEKEEQSKIDQGLRFCNLCKEWKLPNKTNHYCKECSKKRGKQLYDPVKNREQSLKIKYGITIEDYNNLLKDQNNSCYICHKHISELDRSLAVDHNHSTGEVRGLLCGNCNRFLGQINDNIETATRLLEYLKKYE